MVLQEFASPPPLSPGWDRRPQYIPQMPEMLDQVDIDFDAYPCSPGSASPRAYIAEQAVSVEQDMSSYEEPFTPEMLDDMAFDFSCESLPSPVSRAPQGLPGRPMNVEEIFAREGMPRERRIRKPRPRPMDVEEIFAEGDRARRARQQQGQSRPMVNVEDIFAEEDRVQRERQQQRVAPCAAGPPPQLENLEDFLRGGPQPGTQSGAVRRNVLAPDAQRRAMQRVREKKRGERGERQQPRSRAAPAPASKATAFPQFEGFFPQAPEPAATRRCPAASRPVRPSKGNCCGGRSRGGADSEDLVYCLFERIQHFICQSQSEPGFRAV